MTRALFAVSILIALIVSACAQTVSMPTEAAEPSATLTTPVEPTVTPTEPLALQTPSPAPTPIATDEPSPTPVPFIACDALSRGQAEAVIGPLDGDPFELENIGPGSGYLGLCVFPGQLNTASVEVYQYRDAA